jgi:hypothetical protein
VQRSLLDPCDPCALAVVITDDPHPRLDRPPTAPPLKGVSHALDEGHDASTGEAQHAYPGRQSRNIHTSNLTQGTVTPGQIE